jgi:hypothetical protein
LPVVRRLLAVSVVVVVLATACGDDGDGGGGDGGGDADGGSTTSTAVPTTTTAQPRSLGFAPLTVELGQPGAAPLQVLRQELRTGATSSADLDFHLDVEGVVAADVAGESSFDVLDVDDEGTAGVGYALSGLDVSVAAQDAQDALDITGELTLGADRGLTAATVQTQTSGEVPGIEQVATSLDPRLTSLLIPFPTDPIGVGATWTVSGPLPLFGSIVDLTAQMQLVERRQGRYALTAALAVTTPDPEGTPDITLQGLGRLTGDVHEVALRSGDIGLEGTVVLPGSQGANPMSLEVQLVGT